MNIRRWVTGITTAAVLGSAVPLSAASAKTTYAIVVAREEALRTAALRGDDPTLKQIRDVIAAYERIVRRFPTSGYADNALYQAAMLAVDAYRRLVDETDHRTAVRLLGALVTRYPASSLVPKANAQLAQLQPARADAETAVAGAAPSGAAPPAAAAVKPLETPAAPPDAVDTDAAAKTDTAVATNGDPKARPVTIKSIRRLTLPEAVRVLIELEGEVSFHEERVENPARMFVDLKGTRTAPNLRDATLTYPDDAVRQIRIGRHPQNTTRVAIDLADVARYTVFTLYNPYRVVIDCERRPGVAAHAAPLEATVAGGVKHADQPPDVRAATDVLDGEARSVPARGDSAPSVIPSVSGARKMATAAPPSANLQGGFSLSRQLGLGISRIVIDPGHGGHDPGAQGSGGVVESALVLDVALRLEKLLLREAGVEVIMTRRTDEFIPLEERTAIANRTGADLFLSIHANASRNNGARGVETYFLNFASNPEAEAVAARENLTTGRTMNSLADIVRAIALNNKLDESRDFATMVQQSMVQRLRAPRNPIRDLGVKQAPFVVLIGAAMPSVLAEISFVTNRQEAAQLKNGAYRQRIAEALLAAVTRYQRSLKVTRTAAKREAQEK
jgi:N-acetylmuramoyl-L-alanine amidase